MRLRALGRRLPGPLRRPPVLAAILVVAVAAIVVGLVAGGGDDKPDLPEGGSHFGGAASASRSSSLVDALAPLLVGGAPSSASNRSKGRRSTRPIDLPLDRAVAQLFAVGFRGTEPVAPFFEVLRKREYGAVLLGRSNYVSGPQLAALAGEVRVVAQQAGHAVPLVGARQAGGNYSSFPDLPPRAAPVVAASRKAAPVRDEARLAGGQLRALGLNLTIAPDADLSVGGGPAQDRGFSDEPEVASRLVRAAVDGYRHEGVAAAVGHFPGEGAAAQNPDVGPTSVGLTLEELIARRPASRSRPSPRGRPWSSCPTPHMSRSTASPPPPFSPRRYGCCASDRASAASSCPEISARQPRTSARRCPRPRCRPCARAWTCSTSRVGCATSRPHTTRCSPPPFAGGSRAGGSRRPSRASSASRGPIGSHRPPAG